MNFNEISDKVIAILTETNDGEDLSPRHLKLLEMAINGYLNESGYELLNDIYEMVMKHEYVDWFHDIEHLTVDHEGYVYWRGVKVDHYSFRDCTREAAAARKLEGICKKLEAKGIAVNAKSVWDAYRGE